VDLKSFVNGIKMDTGHTKDVKTMKTEMENLTETIGPRYHLLVDGYRQGMAKRSASTNDVPGHSQKTMGPRYHLLVEGYRQGVPKRSACTNDVPG